MGRNRMKNITGHLELLIGNRLQFMDQALLREVFLEWRFYARSRTQASKCQAMVGTAMSALTSCFLGWRMFLANSSHGRFKTEVEMMVRLLQESTQTCKDLRTQLLTVRCDAKRSLVFQCWSVFHAWRDLIREDLHALAALDEYAVRAR